MMFREICNIVFCSCPIQRFFLYVLHLEKVVDVFLNALKTYYMALYKAGQLFDNTEIVMF